MIMSEDEIIDLFLGRILRSKLIKGLLRASKDILLVMGKPVVLRPVVAEAESNPWVQHTEKDLQKATVEDRTEETVSYRYRSQTISMTETETLSRNLH